MFEYTRDTISQDCDLEVKKKKHDVCTRSLHMQLHAHFQYQDGLLDREENHYKRIEYCFGTKINM